MTLTIDLKSLKLNLGLDGEGREYCKICFFEIFSKGL